MMPTASDALCSPNTAHHNKLQNTALSLIRSQVASSTALNLVPPPRCRAIAPSSMSGEHEEPDHQPAGEQISGGKQDQRASTEPAVPMIVTVSGVNPTRSAAWPPAR